ncbi:MAG: hypothetical protein KAT77_03645 [Nanoarchaeota archaeon]|nr:hypothetical protein [Nanoarchaeota archaeon]
MTELTSSDIYDGAIETIAFGVMLPKLLISDVHLFRSRMDDYKNGLSTAVFSGLEKFKDYLRENDHLYGVALSILTDEGLVHVMERIREEKTQAALEKNGF